MHTHPLFQPGLMLLSPEAQHLIRAHRLRAPDLLRRHTHGDWPGLDPSMRIANNQAATIDNASLIVGAFPVAAGEPDAANDEPPEAAHVALITDPGRMTLILTAGQARDLLMRSWRHHALIYGQVPALMPVAYDPPMPTALTRKAGGGRPRGS